METEVRSELYLDPPCDEILEWSKKHVREHPETKYQILDEFRDLIYSRGECTPIRTDDEFLLRFLRGRNFIIEGAYKLFLNYHDFKEEHPEFYDGADFVLLGRIGKHDVLNVPPYREQTGRRMLLFRLGNWDPEIFTVDEIFQATLLILELAILEEQAQILGGIAIFDFSKLSMQQAWYMNTSLAQNVIKIMVTSFYMKINAVHIVNQSWVFDTLFNVFKPFLDERMTKRIFFHGSNMDTLHKHIDPKCLPERYGGVHPDYNYNDWIDGFRASKKIIKELTMLGYKVK